MVKRLLAMLGALVLSALTLFVGISLMGRAAAMDDAPTVTEVEPSAIINDCDTPIVINGADFAAVLSGTVVITPPTVHLGSTSLGGSDWVSTRTLTATVPLGFPSGVYTVTVTNPDGQSGSLPYGLTVQNPTPVLQGVTPDSAYYGEGVTLTVTGTRFVPVPTIALDETPCPSMGYVNSTTLTATAPSGLLPGVYDLRVCNPGPADPQAILTDVFTLYSPTPTVTAAHPSAGPNDMDIRMIITGSRFAPTPTAALGEIALGQVTWVSKTRLTVLVPWGMGAGTYSLTVTNPDPGAASGVLADAFTVTQGLGEWMTGGPYGGEIAGLVLNPVTPTTLYALAHNAGLFVSYDGAANWQPILLVATPDVLVFDAEDPEVMYFGQPLLRTRDGGSTWESMVPPGSYGAMYPAAHPTTPGVVYVTSGRPGLFRSDDYGDTWVSLIVGSADTLVTPIAFHPDDPDKMLAGTPDGNVFLSVDGGVTWDWRAKVSSHIERLYFNPFGAHEAWATTEVVLGQHLFPLHYLYKSEDPELGVWTPITVAGGSVVRSLAFLSDAIWSAGAEGFTTTDGGVSWSPVSRAGLQPGWREDTTAFAMDPGNPDVIYAGDLGQATYKSSDGGALWGKMNEGLAGVVPRGLAVTPSDIDTVYAETSALGALKSSNGGHSWWALGVGKGGFARPLAVDPVTPMRVYMGDQASGYLGIQISEDAGDTWHEVTATLPITWSGWKTDILQIAPHPSISGTILAGGRFLWPYLLPDAGTDRGAIYVSEDHGEDWEYVGPTQPISGVVGFAYDAVDPDLVYAATAGTGLWKSLDGGASWQEVAAFPGGHIVTSVAAHPDHVNTIYTRSEGPPYGGMGAYVSRDAGETWDELLTCDNCGQLLFTPPEPGRPPYALYTWARSMASEDDSVWPAGLHRSLDGGYTWGQVQGAPTGDIYSLGAGSDGERLAIYVGVSGGVASPQSQAATASRAVVGQIEIIPGGVYRWGSRLLSLKPAVYLPLMLRGDTPR